MTRQHDMTQNDIKSVVTRKPNDDLPSSENKKGTEEDLKPFGHTLKSTQERTPDAFTTGSYTWTEGPVRHLTEAHQDSGFTILRWQHPAHLTQ